MSRRRIEVPLQGFDAIRNELGEDEVEPKLVEMPLNPAEQPRMRPKAE